MLALAPVVISCCFMCGREQLKKLVLAVWTLTSITNKKNPTSFLVTMVTRCLSIIDDTKMTILTCCQVLGIQTLWVMTSSTTRLKYHRSHATSVAHQTKLISNTQTTHCFLPFTNIHTFFPFPKLLLLPFDLDLDPQLKPHPQTQVTTLKLSLEIVMTRQNLTKSRMFWLCR